MTFSKMFKYIWWVGLIILFGIVLILRFGVIVSGSPQLFDSILVAIVFILLLLPFYSEITLLGVSFKKQVDEVKEEIKEDVQDQIFTLRTELQNQINLTNSATQQVLINQNPVPDNKLMELGEEIRKALLNLNMPIMFNNQPEPLENFIPSKNTILAFSSRYQIEREITRIWGNNVELFTEADRRQDHSFWQMLGSLIRFGVIPQELGYLIREVYSVGTPAVHGIEPTKEKIEFLKSAVPSLIVTLQSIN